MFVAVGQQVAEIPEAADVVLVGLGRHALAHEEKESRPKHPQGAQRVGKHTLRNAEKGHAEVGADLGDGDELPGKEDEYYSGRDAGRGFGYLNRGASVRAHGADPLLHVGGILLDGKVLHIGIYPELPAPLGCGGVRVRFYSAVHPCKNNQLRPKIAIFLNN